MPPTHLADVLAKHRSQILAIAARHGIRDVRVFGSVARGDAHHDSDVDLLVRLDAGRSLFDLGGFQYEVQELLGHSVDVAMDYDQDTRFARRVRRDARSL